MKIKKLSLISSNHFPSDQEQWFPTKTGQ